MPKIGLRIVKSSIAVFLCFVIYLLRGRSGVPFYSAIAAILCMQPYVSNSLKTAWNRTAGTLIGGVCGLAVLLVERFWIPADWVLIQYFLIALAIVPIIYITVLLKKTTASYITCVVFLSITVSHGADVSPWLFAIDRVLDTLIGIFVSLGVNALHVPRPRRRDDLFICALEGALLPRGGSMSSYTRIRLNHLLGQGANITFLSSQAPSELLPLLEGIEWRLPLVLLSRAALYDGKTMRYVSVYPIQRGAADEVFVFLHRQGIHAFTGLVTEDMLQVYYDGLFHPAQRRYYEETRRKPHRSYVKAAFPQGEAPLFFLLLEPEENMEGLKAALQGLPSAASLSIREIPAAEEGYRALEITASGAESAMLDELKERTGIHRVIAFASGEEDIPFLSQADESYACSTASPAVRAAADHCLSGGPGDLTVKQIAKIYHSRPPKQKD